MKKILLLFLLCISTAVFSQPVVTILPVNQTTCLGGRANFDVIINPDTADYYLQWKRNGVYFYVEDSLHPHLQLTKLAFSDSGYYTVTVVTAQGSFESDTAWVHMLPSLTIDTLYRYNQLGCPGSCKGQMKVHVSGGNPPYDYFWGAGFSQDTIVTSLCKGTYTLSVYDSDSTHCVSREYKVEVLTLPKVVFTTDPIDSVFLTNPTLNAIFPDTSLQRLSSWEWIFYEGKNDQGKTDSAVVTNLNPGQHIYRKTGRFGIFLHYTDLNGCDTTVMDTITVMVAKLTIPDVFTPNGDNVNDNFVIKVDNGKSLAEVYLSNELLIFDRWGKKVYDKKDYISDDSRGMWTGEWDGGNLADGIYFFIFTGHGYYGDDVWKGTVKILGNK